MKVLIGVDSSSFSEDAVQHVIDSPWPKDTTFLVVSVVPQIFIGPGEAVAPRAVTELIEQQQQFHKEVAESTARRLVSAGLKAVARTPYGDPRAMLEEAARSERADLMIVGSHGRSGIQKLLLGSVAAHVVAHAPCPVLVVRVPAWKKAEKRELAVASKSTA